MKKFLLLLAIVVSARAEGQTLGLGWTPPVDLARVTHYRVYAIQGTTSNMVAQVPVGTNKAFFSLPCAADYTLTVLSLDNTVGEMSATGELLPHAMRTAPQVVFNPPASVWQGGGKWNVTVSWQGIAKPYYATNHFVQLTPQNGTPISLTTTNTSTLFSNLGIGNYSVTVRADNWCGQGLVAAQSFQLRGLGHPTDLIILK